MAGRISIPGIAARKAGGPLSSLVISGGRAMALLVLSEARCWGCLVDEHGGR